MGVSPWMTAYGLPRARGDRPFDCLNIREPLNMFHVVLRNSISMPYYTAAAPRNNTDIARVLVGILVSNGCRITRISTAATRSAVQQELR